MYCLFFSVARIKGQKYSFSVFKGYRNATLVFHYAFHWAHALGNKLLDMARYNLETLQVLYCFFSLLPESSLFIFAQLCKNYWFIRTLESYSDSSYLILSVITLKIWFVGSISSGCQVLVELFFHPRWYEWKFLVWNIRKRIFISCSLDEKRKDFVGLYHRQR